MTTLAKPWEIAWEVKDEIDRGGQGVVSEVRSRTDSSKRAVLKQILPRWISDPQARQRLEHEAEILYKLHDLGARVPELLDSSTKHDSCEPFLLMEFVSGVRFDEWLKSQAPVKPQKAVAITRAIAKTIELCHQHEIGHRDPKPSNIILKNGEISAPYILDFGISFDSRQTMALTRDGEMFWNEFIILPECQDLEGGHRDLRSDITALVGVFFSCLTGKPPVVLRDANERAPHQRHEKLVIASANTPEEGERLMWFFQKGFAFRMPDRFQTLDEFVSELMRFAEASSTTALDPLEEYRTLSSHLERHDRKLQLLELNKKCQQIVEPAVVKLTNQLAAIKNQNGTVIAGTLGQNHLGLLPTGDFLGHGRSVEINRNHFERNAGVVVIGIAVGMDIHFYISGYIATANARNPRAWSKVAIAEASENAANERIISLIAGAMSNKLAEQLRKLAANPDVPSGQTLVN